MKLLRHNISAPPPIIAACVADLRLACHEFLLFFSAQGKGNHGEVHGFHFLPAYISLPISLFSLYVVLLSDSRAKTDHWIPLRQWLGHNFWAMLSIQMCLEDLDMNWVVSRIAVTSNVLLTVSCVTTPTIWAASQQEGAKIRYALSRCFCIPHPPCWQTACGYSQSPPHQAMGSPVYLSNPCGRRLNERRILKCLHRCEHAAFKAILTVVIISMVVCWHLWYLWSLYQGEFKGSVSWWLVSGMNGFIDGRQQNDASFLCPEAFPATVGLLFTWFHDSSECCDQHFTSSSSQTLVHW